MPALRTPSAFVAGLFAVIAATTLGGCNGAPGADATSSNGPAVNYPAPKVVTMDEGLPDPVARIGDDAIALQDLEDKAAPAVQRANQQVYQARKSTLDQLINDKLMDAEAKKRGISKDDLMKAEVDGKITPVTDADVQKFYDSNKDRMGSQTFDQIKDKIKSHLEQQSHATRQQDFIKSLRDAAHVQVYLAPPRIKINVDGFPREGSEQAPVQIVEFSDFQCPFCKKAADTVKQVQTKYGDKVSLVYRNYPLPMHKYAHRAAEAGYCAKDQNKFWEYSDALFNNQGSFKDPIDDTFASLAGTAGLDADKFKSCLTGNTHQADVDKDIKDGDKAGMSGTPGFYINGRMLEGAQPIEAFSQVIDDELAQAGSAPAKTTPK